jgi:hypothetical protein
MDVEIHSVIRCLWLRGASNKKIMSQVKETYGDGVIHARSVYRWIHDFAVGRMDLDGLPRPGQPIDPENADRIRTLLQIESCLSQKNCQED